jgi:hypothetical protein
MSGVEAAGFPVEILAPVTDHDASDEVGGLAPLRRTELTPKGVTSSRTVGTITVGPRIVVTPLLPRTP